MNEEPDVMKLLDIRNWLSAATEAKGAHVNGSGMGMGPAAGGADFDFDFDGRHYWVNIREVVDEELERRARR